jgi:hypothetical protein
MAPRALKAVAPSTTPRPERIALDAAIKRRETAAAECKAIEDTIAEMRSWTLGQKLVDANHSVDEAVKRSADNKVKEKLGRPLSPGPSVEEASRLRKKVFRGCRYATLIQIQDRWRTKDSIEPPFGF